jgi:hypothetical protein
VPNRDSITDRMTIVTLLRRYAYAIDDRDFDTVRSLFAHDAHLDYTSTGGPAGSRDEVIAWIEQGLSLVGPTQHIITNELVDLDGATARSRVYLLNPLLSPEDDPSVLLLGGEYRDQWRRGTGGWKIVDRVHLVTWMRPLPKS